MIYDEAELEKIYKTGRGSVKIKAKYNFDKSAHCIEVTEIPPTTTVEAIQDKIGPMDGGMFAATSLNGIEADMLFDEPMEDVGDAILYCVQLRRGA